MATRGPMARAARSPSSSCPSGDGYFYGQSVAVSGDGVRYIAGAPGFMAFRGKVEVWRYDGDEGWSP